MPHVNHLAGSPCFPEGHGLNTFHILILRTLRKAGLPFGRALFLCPLKLGDRFMLACWHCWRAERSQRIFFFQADRWGSDLMSCCHNDGRTTACRNESLMQFVHRLSLFRSLLIQISEVCLLWFLLVPLINLGQKLLSNSYALLSHVSPSFLQTVKAPWEWISSEKAAFEHSSAQGSVHPLLKIKGQTSSPCLVFVACPWNLMSHTFDVLPVTHLEMLWAFLFCCDFICAKETFWRCHYLLCWSLFSWRSEINPQTVFRRSPNTDRIWPVITYEVHKDKYIYI